jgi:hypothetical protein
MLLGALTVVRLEGALSHLILQLILIFPPFGATAAIRGLTVRPPVDKGQTRFAQAGAESFLGLKFCG